MITDDERREVARRMRCDLKNARSRGYYCNDSETVRYICDILGLRCSRCPHPWAGLEALADLMEPSEPKVKCVAEVKVDGERIEELVHDAAVELTGIDRDALLALAEEMVEAFRLGAFTGEGLDAKWCRELHNKYARRIREALGVES